MMQANAGDYIIMHQMGWELDQKTTVVGYPKPCKSAHFQSPNDSRATVYCYGENQRTWETGYLSMTNVYILPTVNPPKPEFVDAFSHLIVSNENREWLNRIGCITSSQHPHLPASRFQKSTSCHAEPLLKYSASSKATNGSIDLPENCSHRPISQPSDVDFSTKSSYVYPFIFETSSMDCFS